MLHKSYDVCKQVLNTNVYSATLIIKQGNNSLHLSNLRQQGRPEAAKLLLMQGKLECPY
jgi:hypothetical protein